MAENEPTTTEEEVRTEEIPYETERNNNPDLESGTENVIQEGRVGELTITESVTYDENGEEINREVISEEVTIEPINEIIDVGTQVTRVVEETRTEPVSFETERQENSSLEKGTENVLQEGREGERTIIEEVTLVNGKETDRRVVSDEITTEAVNKIIEYGTKVPNNNQNRRNKKMSIVWRDKVLSSYNGNIESVLIHNAEGTKEVAVPNGVFVTLGGLAGIGREVKKAVLAKDATKDVLLVASPEVLYETGADIGDFINEAGQVARAFRLADGDVISLTEDLITGVTEENKPEVGDTFVVGAGGKLVKGDEGVVKFVVREDAGNELHRETKAWRFDIVK